jgi:hypothetical protein
MMIQTIIEVIILLDSTLHNYAPVSRSYHGTCLTDLRKTTQNVSNIVKN